MYFPIDFVAKVRRQIANRVPCRPPGENIRTNADVAELAAGNHPPSASKIKGEPQVLL